MIGPWRWRRVSSFGRMDTVSAAVFSVAVFSVAVLPVFAGGLAADDAKPSYNRDIRPILAEHCFKCHGPDSASRKADLRLDQREAAVDAGAFAAGDPDASEAIRRIFSTDREEVMPPPDEPKQLAAAQKELLRRWVQSGAEYQPHWSFITPVRPPLPEVKNSSWTRNAIDAFILARLEAAGLEPAPEAERRTIARRLSLDLRGIPPTPQEVELFVNDTSPMAYERFVDEMLASERWGEHRGRYWLDAARYADTHGIHFDNFREMWTYRDWVIQAFNRNLPFDQFTIEQLAGDLLPERTLDQLIASGFNRCHMTTNEGGIIDEEYLVLYTRDRTETTSQVWMALTMNCCTCHDHKFDPIRQREFYELAAYFNNTTQEAKDGNIKNTPPVITVTQLVDRPRWSVLEKELADAQQRRDARRSAARPDFEKWLASATAEAFQQRLPVEGLHLHAALAEGTGESVSIQVAGESRDVPLEKSAKWEKGPHAAAAIQCTGAACTLADAGDFERDQSYSCSAWINLPANDSHGAIAARMDNEHDYRGWDFWVERRQIGTHIIHHWNQDAIKVVSKGQVKANQWTHVAVTYDGSSKAAGVKVYLDGQPQETNVQSDTLKSTIRTSVPFKIGQRNTSEPIAGLGLHDLRIYQRALTAQEVESLAKSTRYAALLRKPAGKRTEADVDELYGWWLGHDDAEYAALSSEVAKLEREQADIQARGTFAYVMQERDEPPSAFVLMRGDYDKRQDEVKPDTPDILPAMPAEMPRNRLGLARWLVREDHPLTARVTVNRFWQEVFGTGIVSTPGDFGVSGDLPTHPELLDWLAVEFRESGWDIKKFFKMMVMSATYRQSAAVTPAKLEKDFHNRLLSRGPRFRMDAEMIRDYALTASGLLSPKIGGPSVKPYQPDGVWEAIAMNVSNTRSYVPDSGDGLYRRSLYTFWKRMAPPASMEILNAPNREYCVVRRERTNTPLQALVTMNDPQFIEAARRLAEVALQSSADPAARWNAMAQRVLARPFRDEELPIVQKSLDELLAYYTSHVDDAKALIAVGETKPDATLDPPTLAAWTMLANQLLNLDEVLNK